MYLCLYYKYRRACFKLIFTLHLIDFIVKFGRKLTVKTFRGRTFLHWRHNYIPLCFFDQDLVRQAVGGRFVEDAVLFKSQDRLDAVDGGRVVPRALDGACGRRQALIHHHHLGS